MNNVAMSAGIRTGSTHPIDHKQTSRSVSPLHLDEDQVRPPFTEASSDINDKMAQIIDELKKKVMNGPEILVKSKRNSMAQLRDAWFKISEDKSEFLSLPPASSWFKIRQFYIRPCYKGLYSLLTEEWQG
jgi:hypothetical protein